jgi:putative cardiolipin synthase
MKTTRSPIVAMTLLAMALVTAPVACKYRERFKPTKKPTKPAKTAPKPLASVLEPVFSFRCSPDRSVRCKGVFPVRARAPAAGRPSEAAIIWGGEDAFRLRVQTLEKARRSIRIQCLIFRGDEAGQLIAQRLKQKKKEGVDVQVIVDAVSNLDWRTQWLYFDLKKHGIEVEGYEALYLQWLTAEVKPTDPLRPNKRFHEKLWVVDGEDPENAIAIVGGLNIANEYFRVESFAEHRWRDQDVALRGPVVKDVMQTFDRNYRFFKSLKGRLPALFNPDNSWRLARKKLALIKRARFPNWNTKANVSAVINMLVKEVSLDWSPVRARFLQSRPRAKESYIEQAYANLVARAKKRVLIANAYFIPSRDLVRRLKEAARRGVRVVILTNSPQTNDIHSVAMISRYIYADLLEVNQRLKGSKGGIEIHEWQGKPFNEGTLHAKFAIFDGEAAIVGSYNLDPRSARLNSESAVVLEHAALIQRLERYMLEQDLPKAKPITMQQAQAFRKPEDIRKRFKLLFTLPLKQWL